MMYDPSLQGPVLRLLAQWDRLPFSDLERMLEPFQRPKLRMELLRDMEWEGLVLIRATGDELVIELTPRGRARVTERGAAPAAEPEQQA